MAVPRSGTLWRRIFAVLLFGVAASYAYYAREEFPHGGTKVGLTLGTAGLALILLLAYFGIRKRSYKSTFGTLEQWMQSHIYLGILVFIVLLLHTGGRFNDQIAVTTFVLVGAVVFSGVLGAILYVTVPRMLTEVESNLTIEEISDNANQLVRQMARTASGKSAPFQRIYTELIEESKPGWMAGWRLVFTGGRNKKSATSADWGNLLRLVPKEEQDELRQMLVTSRQRKELLLRLMFQQRYKNILEAWLYVHVPFTIALLVFSALHVAAVFYYGSVRW
jgi:uncharacterized membrane protein